MRPFWTKRLSCVFHNKIKPRVWDDEPQEFNSINSLILHRLIPRCPTMTHVPRWSFPPAPGAHRPPPVCAQPQARAQGMMHQELLIPMRSEELSLCCSLCEVQGQHLKEKFKSNSKERYICYQLHTSWFSLAVTCLQIVWMEEIV